MKQSYFLPLSITILFFCCPAKAEGPNRFVTPNLGYTTDYSESDTGFVSDGQSQQNVTWSQSPMEIDSNLLLCGWAEPARSTEQSGQRRQWRMDADDFRCAGPVPVTGVRWWGSYKAWNDSEPPESQPETWHISFWANQVEGLTLDELFPERLVWSLEIPAERVSFEPVGLNQFPQQITSMCFVYEVQLEPGEWFNQGEFESNESVFWISIMAVYPADVEQINMWGWFTRPHTWGNGAVMPAIMGDWPTYDERLFPGRIYPIENSLMCGQNQPYDLCFELLTDRSWIKWGQPFTGSKDWSEYADYLSMAFESDGGELSVLSQVADDWVSESQQPVIAMAWNGSYIGYSYQACACEETIEPNRPDYFLLSIWNDAQPSDMEQNHQPGDKIWEYVAYDYDEVLVGYEENSVGGFTEAVYRYSIELPENAWLRPETPDSVYWFSIMAVFEGLIDEIPYQWGWTNHPYVFRSTTLLLDNRSASPSQWQEYLDKDGGPVDMSFVFFTTPGSGP